MKTWCKIAILLISILGISIFAFAQDNSEPNCDENCQTEKLEKQVTDLDEDISELDRIICNNDDLCLQEMSLAKIEKQLTSIKEDITMTTQSILQMKRYCGIWPINDESKQWAGSKKIFICDNSNRLHSQIYVIQEQLAKLENSTNNNISETASKILQQLQSKEFIFFLASDPDPCTLVQNFCKKYL